MRSRYTAYAIHDATYILATTHPDNPVQPDREGIMAFSLGSRFTGLEIHSYDEDTVTFTASLGDQQFTEKSLFAKRGDRWYYLSGEIIPKPKKKWNDYAQHERGAERKIEAPVFPLVDDVARHFESKRPKDAK